MIGILLYLSCLKFLKASTADWHCSKWPWITHFVSSNLPHPRAGWKTHMNSRTSIGWRSEPNRLPRSSTGSTSLATSVDFNLSLAPFSAVVKSAATSTGAILEMWLARLHFVLRNIREISHNSERNDFIFSCFKMPGKVALNPLPPGAKQPGLAQSLLYSGSRFQGHQKSKGNCYDVEVILKVNSCELAR